MAKVMLVEDDNNLREIYEARLLAEGYEIVSAKDGEEALALAVKEQPDLIISDIMMPNISGFDMLDILRGTPETKNTKVIMMTALSQAEDKVRANKLGADRYLVKSQVTLEDVVKTAQEVLGGSSETPQHETGVDTPPAPTPPQDPPEAKSPQPDNRPNNAQTNEPAETNNDSSAPPEIKIPDTATNSQENANGSAPEKSEDSQGVPADQNDDSTTGTDTISSLPVVEVATEEAPPTNSTEPAPQPEPQNQTDSQAPPTNQLDPSLIAPTEPKENDDSNQSDDTVSTNSDSQSVVHTKVIKPINDINEQKDHLKDLIAEEVAKEAASAPPKATVVTADSAKEGSEAPPPQTVSPATNPDPNSVAL